MDYRHQHWHSPAEWHLLARLLALPQAQLLVDQLVQPVDSHSEQVDERCQLARSVEWKRQLRRSPAEAEGACPVRSNIESVPERFRECLISAQE